MTLRSNIKMPCQYCGTRSESLFSDLTDKDLAVLAYGKTCIKYKKGQTLFYEGTRPMGLFCINSGKVKVYKMGTEGKEQILTLAKPGDFLGYRAILSDEFYNASATVLEEAVICYIPRSNFLEILNSNSAFFNRLMKAVCHKLGVMENKLATIAQKSVRERLATTLLMLKETYGMEGQDSVLIDIALSREDLANIIGTATETVIRLLSEFKNDRLIALEKKKIRVLDTQALMKEADLYSL